MENGLANKSPWARLLTSVALFILFLFSTPLVFAGTARRNIKTPIGLICARILDSAFPSLRDPVKMAFRRIDSALIRAANDENDNLPLQPQMLARFIAAATRELALLPELDQIDLLRAITPDPKNYRLGLPKAVWQLLKDRGEAEAFQSSVKLWAVDELLARKNSGQALFGLAYVLINESNTEAVSHIQQNLLDGFTGEAPKFVTKKTVLNALQTEYGRLQSRIFSDIVKRDASALNDGELADLKTKMNHIALNLVWLKTL